MYPIEYLNIYYCVFYSVADPECFDADPDPDPTVQADADPDQDPNPFTGVKKKIFLQIFNYSIVSKVFQNLSCVIFSARMREEG